MSENTSALTFSDLIIEVADKLGVAYFGVNGDEAAQVPTDAHDLAKCKKIVNKGIRMFINDAPLTGWRWTRPIAGVTLWGDIAVSASNTVTASAYVSASDDTPIVAQSASFYPSMERKTITITGFASYTITRYISATSVAISGDHHTIAAKTWSMTADGDYTLPQTFGGQFTGQIAFAAGTNRGFGKLTWTDESTIRMQRANITRTGTPFEFAVRMLDAGTPRRRWTLMAFPIPNDTFVVQFPFDLHFDLLSALTDTTPAPVSHDETIQAACLAAAERDVEDTIEGPAWQYYRGTCLPNSYRVDDRSGPRTLGYFSNPSAAASSSIHDFRDHGYQRPTVTFNQ